MNAYAIMLIHINILLSFVQLKMDILSRIKGFVINHVVFVIPFGLINVTVPIKTKKRDDQKDEQALPEEPVARSVVVCAYTLFFYNFLLIR